jgi:hypothetical protein
MLSALVGLPAAWIYLGPLPLEAQRLASRLVTAAKEAIGLTNGGPSTEPWVRVAPARPAPKAAEESSAPVVAISTAPPPLVAPRTAPAKPPTLADRLDPLLARLRQLGAAEYALEHWGEGGTFYRFHCEMPVGATQLTQQFEAIAADPQNSVEQVVAEVTSWQLSRQTSGM